MELTSTANLLSMDNTVKNPLAKLKISAMGVERECLELIKTEVNFGENSEPGRFNRISISVRGVSQKWADEMFSKLEEQIERTFLSSLMYRFNRDTILPLIFFALMAVSIFSFVTYYSPLMTPFNLSKDQASAMTHLARTAKTQEEKIGFIFEVYRRQLDEPKIGPLGLNKLLSWRSLFLTLPGLLLLGSIIYGAVFYYPRTVFLWGDYEEYYSSLITKRRTLWTVVVISLLIGLLGNLFVASLPLFK